MYYIWDTLAKSGAVANGKIINQKPIRITGNYSKAAYVYNFLEEPAMRGSQIIWIDQIENVETPKEVEKVFTPLFDGESLKGWSKSQAWSVKDKALSCSALKTDVTAALMSESSHTDFELSFEYRSSWGNSASILLRANEKGEGIALSLDHIDGGNIGFPKSAAGASRPFTLYKKREQRGVGAKTHYHVQYDGRPSYDSVARDKLINCSNIHEFLREWDGAFWNVVRVRCVGDDPVITVWINGFQVNKFKANTIDLREKNPAHIGAIENFAANPSGRVGVVVHATTHDEPEFLLREVRIAKAVAD